MIPRKLGVPAGLVLFLAGAAAFLVLDAPSRDGWTTRRVTVPKGSAVRQIVERFAQEGVLEHRLAFRALVFVSGTGRHLHFGEYVFPVPVSTYAVWRKLVDGDVTRAVVTVTEGSTMFDVARTLSEKGLVDAAAFLRCATSHEVLARLGIDGADAEGYLFPDTYDFVKTMSAEEILDSMVRQFRRKLPPGIEQAARASGLTLRQVVIIASIIEKETGVPEEKPLVSAVIRNRLRIGMPLQMDPTVIYGLRSFGAELTKADLRAQSPYNSYRNKGLPPGPIANPGPSSLRAAVFPADADYLYFVSRYDGSHRFSRTLEEHNRAVALLRKAEAAAESEANAEN